MSSANKASTPSSVKNVTKKEVDNSIPEDIQNAIRQVAGNNQPINFNRRLDEIYKFHQKPDSECREILEKLRQELKNRRHSSPPNLHGGTRPACIVMYYEKLSQGP